jgi:hypothetical protein
MIGDSVEQILFGFDGALRALHWSAALSRDEVNRWSNRLERYLRLSPTGIGEKRVCPGRAFSYFEFDNGEAALLARFDREGDGRNTSHALLGTVESLGPYATSLAEWGEWMAVGPRTELPSADRAQWENLRSRWRDDLRLRPQPEEWFDVLTLVVGAIRRGRDVGYYSIALDVDEVQALAVMTVLRGVLEPLLSQPPKGGWTFSTYERYDSDNEASPYVAGAPTFWFVRAYHGATDRQRISLSALALTDDEMAAARDLVMTYLDDPDGYEWELARRRQGGAHRAAVVAPGVDAPANLHETVRVGSAPQTQIPSIRVDDRPPDEQLRWAPGHGWAEPAPRNSVGDPLAIIDALRRGDMSPKQRYELLDQLTESVITLKQQVPPVPWRRFETALWVMVVALLITITVVFISILVPNDVSSPTPGRTSNVITSKPGG